MDEPNAPKKDALTVHLVELAPLHPRRRLGACWAMRFAHGQTAYFASIERALDLIEREKLNLIRPRAG